MALIVGTLLAIVNGIRICLMYDWNIMLALALGITMIAVVIMGKMHRVRTAAGGEEDRARSGDHGGASDHYDTGYLHDPRVL